jgi:hypothetical protein
MYMNDLWSSAGGNPLYVGDYLQDVKGFVYNMYNEILLSIHTLKSSAVPWEQVKASVICSVLERESSAIWGYDRKYLVRSVDDQNQQYLKPIVPAVTAAYRHHFWNEIMEYIERQEDVLLAVCHLNATTNDTRNRMIQHIILCRIQSRGLHFMYEEVDIKINPGAIVRFRGSALPSSSELTQNVVYVPDSPIFPAIDFFLLCENCLIAFQVHAGSHRDVSDLFLDKCRQAQWFEAAHRSIEKHVVIYLSPNQATAQLVHEKVNCTFEIPGQPGIVYAESWTFDDFLSFQNLQWQIP